MDLWEEKEGRPPDHLEVQRDGALHAHGSDQPLFCSSRSLVSCDPFLKINYPLHTYPVSDSAFWGNQGEAVMLDKTEFHPTDRAVKESIFTANPTLCLPGNKSRGLERFPLLPHPPSPPPLHQQATETRMQGKSVPSPLSLEAGARKMTTDPLRFRPMSVTTASTSAPFLH